jgi:putative ABC transport system permease protein
MMGLFQDVKYGLRMMAKSPWFTLAAVLTLALGIGVNSAGFSLANALWWAKLPFKNPQEVVTVAISDGSGPPNSARMSYPEFADIRAGAKSFKALTVFAEHTVVLSSKGNPGQRYSGASVTPNLFSFLDVRPILGRDFTPADEKWGQPAAVLISHNLWQTRYGGKQDVVGQSLRLDANPAVIIGVMPPGFTFPTAQQVWTPIRPYDTIEDERSWRRLTVFGRLADGVGIQQARAEVTAIAKTIAQDHPDTNKGYGAVVLTLIDWTHDPGANVALQIILGAVAFILLIACANAANLLLSRAVQRAREVSVRTALGASRWRIARQVLVESVMLSLLGGVLGFFLGQAGVRWFVYAVTSAGASEFSSWITFELDYRAFAYFLGICVATGIVFGSVPAYQISKTNVNDNLKEGSHQSSGGSRARRMAAALLVAEIALTVMLVAESGLLLREFLQMTQLDSGIDSRGLITARLDLPYATYPRLERAVVLENFVERFQRPDRPTTFAWAAPLEGTWNMPMELEGRAIADAAGKPPWAGTVPVGNNYFSALNVKIVRGRDFEARDGRPGAEAVIVNQRFAREYWPSENPIGKRLRLALAPGLEKTPWMTVVGVSPDLFQTGGLQTGPGPTIYVPYRLNPTGGPAVILVRSAQTEATVRDLRAELGKIDHDLAPYSIMTFHEVRHRANGGNRFFATLIGGLSLMALVMASVGLYGVTAHGVNQRRREIGIRAALGASRLRVIWMIFRQSLPRIVAGLAIGLVGGALLSRLTTTFVIVVVDSDPLIFLSTFLVISLVTTIAVLIPALRAAQLNPCEALRSE